MGRTRSANALHALNPKLDAMYDRYDTGTRHRRVELEE